MSSARRSLLLFIAVFAMATAVHAAGPAPASEPTGPATSTDVIMLLVYISMALVFSFLCSVAEAVLLSLTPSYIANLGETHPKRAALLKKLKQENVDRSLAAILTLNTIAHTVGAIGSGAKATVVFGSAWFGVFSAVMTLLILFLSEIVPKTLGAVYWRSFAGPTAMFVRGLIIAMYPLIVVSEALTRLIAKGKKVHAFSRDEFIAMTHVGEQAGKLKEDETRIIRNLFRLESLRARDIMTPRTVIVGVDMHLSVREALEKVGDVNFSRLPVYDESMDSIKGFVLRTDLLLAAARDEHDQLVETMVRELETVPGTMPISRLMENLLDHNRHVALVIDDFGGTEGLVTLEDVVETLLGTEIVDEVDTVEDLRKHAREMWQKRH